MKRTTLHEAQLLYAKALKEHERLRLEWQAKDDQVSKQAWEDQDRKNGQLLAQFAADPELRKHMQCCMVDFHGRQEPEWAKEKRDPADAELTEALRVNYTKLGQTVRDWIEHNGFRITDSGGGLGGWDLGVPGSFEDSVRLCDLAYNELAGYIQAGVLDISLKLWGWRFKDFNRKKQEWILQGN